MMRKRGEERRGGKEERGVEELKERRINGVGSPRSPSIHSVPFKLITLYFLFFSHNHVIIKVQ
jgi:hypothetical protein